MEEPIVKQVGGDHYLARVQHWDPMERFDVSYLEATATKYVTRWRKKGVPVLDLGKAISYLDRIAQEGRGTRRTVPVEALQAFYEANAMDPRDSQVIDLILLDGHGSPTELLHARDVLQGWLNEMTGEAS